MKPLRLCIAFSGFLLFCLLACDRPDKDQPFIISAPATTQYTHINEDGTTVIPNGRFITPTGKTLKVAPHPFGLTVSPDGSTIVTANSGFTPFSISIIEEFLDENPTVTQLPDGIRSEEEYRTTSIPGCISCGEIVGEGNFTSQSSYEYGAAINQTLNEDYFPSIFMGLAISPDNKLLYVSGGEENKIFKVDLTTRKIIGSIDCNQKTSESSLEDYSYGFIGEIVLSKDGKILYGVDQRNFRVFIMDVATEKILHNIAVGRYPFSLCLTPDEDALFVANVGAFEYKHITSLDEDNMWESALDFPVYKYMSKEMIEGIDTDTLKVPPLGDPNVPESFSVWKIDLATEKPAVTAKIKTGILVGELVDEIPAVGGSSPNSVAATDQYVFVSNGHNDCISVIDLEQDTVVNNIYLQPDERLGNLRGIIPFGLTVSSDYQRLYVTESGINAVAVIDIPSMRVIGHIPTGWFPAKVKLTHNDQTLVVSNAKGYGSGPNGGKDVDVEGIMSYIGFLVNGTVSIIDMPEDDELPALTQKVIDNNFRIEKVTEEMIAQRGNNPIPLYPGQKESPIKHFVYIVKENRTYDQVFGQLGRGDSTLTEYGYRANINNKAGTNLIENVDVMPNHLKLAREYAISDNFYCDGDQSLDGHWWLVNAYPNDWIETEVVIEYGGGKSQIAASKAPGELAYEYGFSQLPEDYNEAGSMWEHLDRYDQSFYNFGLDIWFTGLYNNPEETGELNPAVKTISNFPISEVLFDNTSRRFPSYNMGIPEQYRADVFIEEFSEKWLSEDGTSPKGEMPGVIVIYYGADHGADERPEDGYPYWASYLADNDLALGRTVEFLSNTPYWKNMAIIVTEDDAQDGRDHIDAHRSILMMISPYAKKNYISKVHNSFGSTFKTIWNTFGMPCLNQYDVSANDFSDMFTDEPDISPYKAVPVDKRIFDPEKVLTPKDKGFNWQAVKESPALDNLQDFLESHSKN